MISDRWHVREVLSGPYGVVYVVFDGETGEVLAAKTFSDALLHWDGILPHRLKKEALPWLKLDRHRNVVQPRFIRSIDGCPLLFMEYVCGTHLGHWIGSTSLTDNPATILRFALQLCDGLEHAQSNGIGAHRDIRPENCLITAQRVLKIADPGLSRALDDSLIGAAGDARSPSRARTRADLAELVHGRRSEDGQRGLAAAAYLAPEQFAGSKHVDLRADIYAFGVLLFQMVTGNLPFSASSWVELEQLHKTLVPLPLLPERHQLFADVIQTCLAKEAPRRFTDFAAVRRQLEQLYRLLTGETGISPPDGEEIEAEDWDNQGLGQLRFGYLRQALSSFEHALELSPDHPVLWAHKGETLRQLGQSDEALICHQVSLELDSKCVAAWYHRGLTLRVLERFSEALACQERAIELDPGCWQAWMDKGLTLAALGQRQAELACYDRVQELNPRHGSASRS
ncbi:MAG: protein kinase domain-containing protein [Acidiferrobacterales bacterium]